MKTISDLNKEIRSFINEPDFHSLISMDDSSFNPLCSCLDLIGDTELALDAYISMSYPEAIGEKYLVLYGALASMRLQQDAIKNLFEALQIQYHEDEALIRTREVIDSVIINASKKEVNGVHCAYQITQSTLSHSQFTLWTLPSGDNPKRQHIQVLELIHNQRKSVRGALSAMLKELHR